MTRVGPVRRSRLVRAALVTAMLAAVLPVVSSTSTAHATTPTWAFNDLGSIATVGEPLGVTDDGTVATSYGVWSKGTFTPVPGGAGSFVIGISADGLVLATSTTACAEVCAITWDPKTDDITSYPRPAETRAPNGDPCGGGRMYGIDPTHETYGYIQDWNPASTFDHCVGGQTIQFGAYYATPGTATPTHVPELDNVLDLTQHYALGVASDGTTTLLKRSDSSVTAHADLALSQQGRQQLTDDGAIAALQGPSLLPSYTSPAGVTTILPHPDLGTYVSGMNASHQLVGLSNAGGIYWSSPTAAPVTVQTLTTIPADYQGDSSSTADFISDTGNIVGQFHHAPTDDDHVYALTVGNDLTASIALTNANGTAFTGAGTKVGDTVKATVTLHNGSATNAITGLSAGDPPLTVAPGSALTLTSGPTPAVPSSLAVNDTQTYAMTYTVAKLGKATLSVNLTGTENALPTTAFASVVAHLGQALQVTVTFTHTDGSPVTNNTIKMTDTDTAEVPQDLTAVVTIKNVSGVQQDNVAFNGALIPSFHKVLPSNGAVPVTVTSGPTDTNPSTPLTPLAPDATAKRTYGFHLTDNGVFDFSSQLTSGDHDGGGTNVSGGVGTLTANPTAILFLKLHPVTDVSKLLTPGQPVLLAGQVVNRSNTQTIDLVPIVPTEDSGANAGGGMIRDSSVSPLDDGVELPLAGNLAPGKVVQVEAEIGTAPVPGSRASLQYIPEGYIVNDDKSETELKPEQIRVAAGSSPIDLHFDVRDPVDTSTPASLAGEFAKAAFIGVSEWYLNGFTAASEILQHPLTSAYTFGGHAVGFVQAAATTAAEAARLLGAVYVFTVYSASLTDAERLDFSNQIVADYEKSGINTAHQALQKAADPVLLKFETAIQTGNWTQVAQMSGSGLATGTTAVADVVLGEIAFQKIALLAKSRQGVLTGQKLENAIALGDSLKKLGVVGKPGAALKGVEAGMNLLARGGAVLQDTYGLTKRQITLLRDFCEANGITVALRSRSAKAAELIKKGIAVGKNLVIKLKNVDTIDTLFLGYSKADINTLVWAEPISHQQLLKNIERFPGMTPELRDVAIKRWQQRVEEWHNPSFKSHFKEWEESGQIQLEFGGKDSGVGQLDASRMRTRRFAFDDRSKVQGRYYKKLQVGKRAGLSSPLAYITQDVDLVAILGGNGEILSPKLRAKAYEYLEDILGIEHPDTVPWLLDGEMFKTKAKLLIDHLEGGEALAVFAADGTSTAGYFDPLLTVFDSTAKSGYIFFKGAYNNPYARIAIGALGKLL